MSTEHSAPGVAQSRGGFIPSIEGMRSLAVLAVLLFHLDIHVVGSGYLGVDLFFVISGFIITRNILFDLQLGTFSLREFYVRRVRRLLPALLVTVLLSLLVAIATLPPIELEKTAKSALYAIFSVANFNFWWESGYFDAAAHTKPLLHTWSLSVEEQFYLLWPAVLLWFANTRRRLIFTVSLLLMSVVASLLLRDSMPSAVFYLLPFRVHQLMVGALVAIASLHLSVKPGNISTMVATLGFLCIVVLSGDSVSPVVGAMCVSALGFFLLLGRESPWAQLVYGNRPMQWLGKRSYAIYLVHWPVIVLFKYFTDFQLNPGERASLFCISIIAAVALHELIEKPFRKKGVDSTLAQRFAPHATAFTLLATISVAASLWVFHGLPGRIDPGIQRILDSVERENVMRRKAIRFGRCNLHMRHPFSDYDVDECATTDPELSNVLIIGDSMASDIYMMLSQSYSDIQFLQATAGACTAILNITHTEGKYPGCQQLNAFRFSELLELDIDLVVLASAWKEERIQPLKKTVAYLQSRGQKVLVIGPRSVFQGSVPRLISRQSSVDSLNRRLRYLTRQKKELLQQMRGAMPGVEIVDIATIQCSPFCQAVEGERLLFVDSLHFTRLGAKRVGERFKRSFDLQAFIDASLEHR